MLSAEERRWPSPREGFKMEDSLKKVINQQRKERTYMLANAISLNSCLMEVRKGISKTLGASFVLCRVCKL